MSEAGGAGQRARRVRRLCSMRRVAHERPDNNLFRQVDTGRRSGRPQRGTHARFASRGRDVGCYPEVEAERGLETS